MRGGLSKMLIQPSPPCLTPSLVPLSSQNKIQFPEQTCAILIYLSFLPSHHVPPFAQSSSFSMPPTCSSIRAHSLMLLCTQVLQPRSFLCSSASSLGSAQLPLPPGSPPRLPSVPKCHILPFQIIPCNIRCVCLFTALSL